jgi:hypothetical protein
MSSKPNVVDFNYKNGNKGCAIIVPQVKISFDSKKVSVKIITGLIACSSILLVMMNVTKMMQRNGCHTN